MLTEKDEICVLVHIFDIIILRCGFLLLRERTSLIAKQSKRHHTPRGPEIEGGDCRYNRDLLSRVKQYVRWWAFLSCKATYLFREAKIKKGGVGACIDMDGVCGDIRWWKRIVKHRSL
jgi:hypothetical protein